MDRFRELVKKAKLDSKKEFIKFATGVYGVDECIFEHILDIPVIGLYEEISEFIIPLSTKSKDELLDILEEYIKEKIGNNNSCFIYLNEMEIVFTQEEIEEWQKELYSDEAKHNYDAIIVYNETKLRKKYKELIKNNSNGDISNSQEDVDKIFTEYVKGIITYEICNLNADYLIKSEQNLKNSDLDYMEERRILIDILKQIVNIYEKGLSVEECLYNVLKGKINYTKWNNKQIILLYILFIDELTEWVLFGAYDYVKENKLKNHSIKVFGTDNILSNEDLNEKLCKYLSNSEEKNLSKKQIEMIKMLGLSIINDTHKEEISEVFLNNIHEDKKDNAKYSLKLIDEKNNIFKKIFSKVLNFFRNYKSNIRSWE